MKKYNYKSIIIVSDEPHTRRISILIKNFTKFNELNIKYVLVGSNVKWWNKKKFFENKKAVFFSIQESLKIIHNIIIYNLKNANFFTSEEVDIINNHKEEFTKIINAYIKSIYNLINSI